MQRAREVYTYIHIDEKYTRRRAPYIACTKADTFAPRRNATRTRVDESVIVLQTSTSSPPIRENLPETWRGTIRFTWVTCKQTKLRFETSFTYSTWT